MDNMNSAGVDYDYKLVSFGVTFISTNVSVDGLVSFPPDQLHLKTDSDKFESMEPITHKNSSMPASGCLFPITKPVHGVF